MITEKDKWWDVQTGRNEWSLHLGRGGKGQLRLRHSSLLDAGSDENKKLNYSNIRTDDNQRSKRMNNANIKLMRIQKWKLLLPCRAHKSREACRKGKIVGIQFAENTRI